MKMYYLVQLLPSVDKKTKAKSRHWLPKVTEVCCFPVGFSFYHRFHAEWKERGVIGFKTREEHGIFRKCHEFLPTNRDVPKVFLSSLAGSGKRE